MNVLRVNHRLLNLAVILFVSLFSTAVFAEAPIYTGLFSNKALAGYDTVAYFTDNKAVEGRDEFKTEYKGAEWLFKSQENLNKFLAAPEKYAPQYGGYCAWAVAQNKTAKGDPEHWYIHEGKLYLNYNDGVQQAWLKDKVNFISRADQNWPTVLN